LEGERRDGEARKENAERRGRTMVNPHDDTPKC
jgi:hypothetical protein